MSGFLRHKSCLPRQSARTHERFIYRSSALAAFTNRPHNQALTAAHVTTGIDFVNVGFLASGFVHRGFDVAGCVFGFVLPVLSWIRKAPCAYLCATASWSIPSPKTCCNYFAQVVRVGLCASAVAIRLAASWCVSCNRQIKAR
jgi:hypothetical protein